MSIFNHSTKVPRIYKVASTIARLFQEKHKSIKELVFDDKYRHYNTKALYALAIETVQHADVLDQLLSESRVLIDEPRLDPWLARVLVTELLWGKKTLPTNNSKPIQTILSLHDTFIGILKGAVRDGTHENKPRQNKALLKPRYVRVNTLALSVGDAVTTFREEGWKRVVPEDDSYASYLAKMGSLGEHEYLQDYHLKEVFVFPPGTEFYNSELYTSGSLVLQDKATALAPFLLNPPPGSIVLDMCAAPGVKTTHLAAMMKDQGTLYAVERDAKRYKTMCSFVETHSATCVKPIKADASMLTPLECRDVEYILVDPTCSSSGMARAVQTDVPQSRLDNLAKFQIILLEKALTAFPGVKRVVYSTCSVHSIENEEVVDAVLKIVNPDPACPNYELVDPPAIFTSRGSDQFMSGPKCLFFSPDTDNTIGFFVATFQRIGSASLEGLGWRNAKIGVGTPGGKGGKKRKMKQEECGSVEESEEMLATDDGGEDQRKKKKVKQEKCESVEEDKAMLATVDGGKEKRKKKKMKNV